MSTPAVVAPEPSPVEALSGAYEHTRRLLFPFKFERWLALGLVAFLDQCGRGGIGGSFPSFPGGGGGSGAGSDGGGSGSDPFAEIGAWMGQHVALVAGLAAGALAVIVALMALVLWINSRATFVYIEDVATGSTDIARPWAAHAERAWSYFAWRFTLGLGVMTVFVSLVGLGIAAVLILPSEGYQLVMILLLLVPLLLAVMVAAALLSVGLRDFAAPIQMAAGVGCGSALRLLGALVRRHPLAFFVYVMLKIVLGIAQGSVLLVAACFTCCCILIPVVTQTFLQPLFFFERAWPLYLLRQMGYDLVTGPVPAPAVRDP